MDWTATVLSYLASVTARSLVLFALAAAVMLALRVKAAAAQHAVWTVVAGGMLVLAAIAPALPPIPVRVLKPVDSQVAQFPDTPAPNAGSALASSNPTPGPARTSFTWKQAAAAVYILGALVLLVRLAFGYLFTRRLIRAAIPIARFDDVYRSGWITVPLTVGRKILLPEGWESWEEAKLQAVLAHEHTHVRRADWAIMLLAGVNRCVFWFHPLAWWLERRLAELAEQACDDSALLLVDTQPYAQALLDMAAAVNSAQGRVVWEAMAMAKAAEVRKRIERILDETRQIPRGLTRARWVALVVCSVPLVWLAAVTQLAPAIAQEPPRTPAAMSEFLKGHRQLTPADVNMMEQYLAANPGDVNVRLQLVFYYYANGVREPRISHIVYLIEHVPQMSGAVFASQGMLPRESSLNSLADYQRVLGAWKQAAAAQQNNPPVLGNAAQFMQAVGEWDTAEALFNSALALQPGDLQWKDRLGKLYAAAILGATGDPKYPNLKPEFANRVRSQLMNSQDGFLLFTTGTALRSVARRPEAGRPLPQGVLNLDDHPLLNSAIDFGQQLIARAPQFGGPREMVYGSTGPGGGTLGGIIGSAPSRGTLGGVAGGTSGGVMGGIIGSVPSSAPQLMEQLPEAPPVMKKVEPVYPPLARQARISGIVSFRVTIGTDGSVRHIEVMKGHPLLVPPAIQALKEWTFQAPSTELTAHVEIPFILPPGDYPAPDLRAGKSVQGETPSRIRVGANVQAAKLTHRVDPIYPAQARAEGIEGSVTLQIQIGEDGQVEKAEPIDGNPVLAGAAEEAVKQWTYQPTLFNGQPVTVITTVVVPFQLR
jgi:TonB family protein